MNVFYHGPYRITQRAAWPMTYCVQANPGLIRPHLRKVLRMLAAPGTGDAVKRNAIRMLQFVQLPPALQGLAADVCFSFLQNRKEAIAIRVFAMSVLASIAADHPDLQGTLRIIIEDELPYASPAFRSRARKVLKTL